MSRHEKTRMILTCALVAVGVLPAPTARAQIPKPIVQAEAATNIRLVDAVLRGRLTEDRGYSCQYKFFYWKSSNLATIIQTSWKGSVREGIFSEAVGGLDPGTSYTYRCQARYRMHLGSGIYYYVESVPSSTRTFTTLTGKPTVRIDPATNVTDTSARLKGTITNDKGYTAQMRFVYSRADGTGGVMTAWRSVGWAPASFSETVTGLDCSTRYKYRCQAKITIPGPSGMSLPIESEWSGWADFSTDKCPCYDISAPPSQRCVGWYQYNYGLSIANFPGDGLSYGACWTGDHTCRDEWGDDELGDYKGTFGSCEVCWCSDIIKRLGCTGHLPHALAYYPFYRYANKDGHCFGICMTSLELYYGDHFGWEYAPTLPWTLDQFGVSRADDIPRKAVDEIIKPHIRSNQGRVMSDVMISQWLNPAEHRRRGANNVLARAREDWARNPRRHGIVTIFEQHGLDLDPLSVYAHSVIVDSIEDDNHTNTAKIYVYDSNRNGFSHSFVLDGDYPFITIDKTANTYSFKMAGREKPYCNEDYEPHDAIIYHRFPEFSGDVDIPLSLDFDYDLIRILCNIGQCDVAVEDTQGRTIGTNEHGKAVSEIPNAMILPTFQPAADVSYEITFALPRGAYSVLVRGRTPGRYSAHMLGGATVFDLQDVEFGSNTLDALHIDQRLEEISIVTSDTGKRLGLEIVKILQEGDEPVERVFKISNAEIYAGSTTTIGLTQASDAIVYSNMGSRRVTYALEVTTTEVPEDGWEPVVANQVFPTASLGHVVIEPMETQILAPRQWSDLFIQPIDILQP